MAKKPPKEKGHAYGPNDVKLMRTLMEGFFQNSLGRVFRRCTQDPKNVPSDELIDEFMRRVSSFAEARKLNLNKTTATVLVGIAMLVAMQFEEASRANTALRSRFVGEAIPMQEGRGVGPALILELLRQPENGEG